jgi:hypothetical protein
MNSSSKKSRSIGYTLVEKERLDQQAGIPICGANLSTPVIDTSNFISEIRYQIGNKLYIENAD